MGLQNGLEKGGYTSSAANLIQAHKRSTSLNDRTSFQDNHVFDLQHEDPYYGYNRGKSMLRRTPAAAIVCFLVLVFTFWFGKQYGSYAASSTISSSSAAATSPSIATNPHDISTATSLGYARNTVAFTNGTTWQRPSRTKIVGIIFFGRRQFVDILDCYLRRNLAVNGGLLDEIHFLLHTDDQQDKEWLKNLIEKHGLEEYYKLKAENTDGAWSKWTTFQTLYKNFMTDPDTIYVKVDDDLMFIDDYAIPELLKTVLEHPEAHSVVSNNVNNRWNYWHHHRTNAIHPYLAEQDPSSKWPINTWRPSQLPFYKDDLPPKMFNFSREYKIPNSGHRWLPLEQTQSRAESVSHTPWGPWLPNPMFHTGKESASWGVVAQAHYSFFENLERGQLNKYYFGNGEDGVWNLWYSRWNINFFAITGKNVLLKPFWGDEFPDIDKGDEFLLTTVIPKLLDMPVLVATRSITSHYSFRGDREYLLETDVLDRYRALANELFCQPRNQKKRFGKALGPHHVHDGSSPDHPAAPSEHVDVKPGDGPADVFNSEHDAAPSKETNPEVADGRAETSPELPNANA